MAAQVTHVALANRIFSKYFSNLSKQDFIIGTTFADIRYLGHVKRNQTHRINVSFDDVLKEKSSFQAGLLFHSFIDELREKFMVESGVYDFIPKTHPATQAIKFLEEKFFYKDVKNWLEITNFYNVVLEEELDFGMPKEVIMFWHNLLVDFFHSSASIDDCVILMKKIGIGPDNQREVVSLYAVMEQNTDLVNMINKFHDQYESLIENNI